MGDDAWFYGLFILVACLSAGILVAGVLLLRAMGGVRAWNFYLGALAVTLLGLAAAAVEMNLRWERAGMQWADGVALSDEAELRIAPYLGAPFICLFVVFIGGLLLYLLGRTAAQDRASQGALVPWVAEDLRMEG